MDDLNKDEARPPQKIPDKAALPGRCHSTLPPNTDPSAIFKEMRAKEEKERKVARSKMAAAMLLSAFGVGCKKIEGLTQLASIDRAISMEEEEKAQEGTWKKDKQKGLDHRDNTTLQ